MNAYDRLDELLERWEASRAQGTKLTAEELCADCPDLIDEVRRRIAALLAMDSALGTATGDLKGGLGVIIASATPKSDGSVIFQNQHHWVTESGGTLFLGPAEAIAYPSPIAGVYAVSYPNGITLTGGTGAFAGATGTIAVFGAVDLGQQQLTLRYAGQVCFKPVPPLSR